MSKTLLKVIVVGLTLVVAVVPSVGLLAGPSQHSPGQPGQGGGVQFATPFIVGITALLVNVLIDCVNGKPIAAALVSAEFAFKDGTQAPFALQALTKIILRALGYAAREFTSFTTLQLGLGPFALVFIALSQQSVCLMPADTVLWDTDRKLKWEDFQGKPDDTSEYHAWTVSGFTTIEWSCDEKGVFEFEGARAYFDQSESWVKDGKQTDALLEHEQGHFNITEIYARKLRETLRKIKCDGKTQEQIQQEVDQAYEQIKKEWEAEQKKYDDETKHGEDKEKQKEWNEKIKKQLEATKGQ